MAEPAAWGQADDRTLGGNPRPATWEGYFAEDAVLEAFRVGRRR